jgi:hypothetical protein
MCARERHLPSIFHWRAIDLNTQILHRGMRTNRQVAKWAQNLLSSPAGENRGVAAAAR